MTTKSGGWEPKKFNPEIVETILSLIRRGIPKIHAANAAGINIQTLANWQNESSEFSELLARAQSDAIALRVSQLHDAIQGALDIKDYRTAGMLSIEYLKRRTSDFTEKQEAVDHNVNVKVTMTPQLAAQEVLKLLGKSDVIDADYRDEVRQLDSPPDQP